eukprot:2445322-Rhodomonas_salina.3
MLHARRGRPFTFSLRASVAEAHVSDVSGVGLELRERAQQQLELADMGVDPELLGNLVGAAAM